MKHKPAMYALLDLHSTLGGEILKNKERAAELADAMRHVEAVIKMLDPQFSLRGIAVKRRKRNQWFKRGTLYRKALDVLRKADKPMTATELGDAVLAAAGIQPDDRKAVQILGRSINSSLRNHAGKGVQQVGEGACPLATERGRQLRRPLALNVKLWYWGECAPVSLTSLS